MPKKTQGLRSFHHKSRNGCTQCKRRKVKCDMQAPLCGSCTRRHEACEYRRIENYPNTLLNDCTSRQIKGVTSPAHEGLARSRVVTSTSMMTNGAQAKAFRGNTWSITRQLSNENDFIYITQGVLKRAWFAESESVLWAKVLKAETRKTPYLGHCILSLASLQAPHPSQRAVKDSISAYQHHVQASELFRKVTPVVTQHNWLAVLAFQVFVLVFELTTQTYCTEADFDLPKTLRVLRWNSKIGREAQPYFVVSKLWQVIVKRTNGIDLPPDPALQASLRALGSAIDDASAGTGNDFAKQRRAKICQEAFRGLCAWVDYCSSWPRSIDGYYYFPASLQPQFFEMLEEGDDMALVLVLYWSVVLWRSPMPAVWKWAYRTAHFVMRILERRPRWLRLLEWPRRVLFTAALPRSGGALGDPLENLSKGEERCVTDPWKSASSNMLCNRAGNRNSCVIESMKVLSKADISPLAMTGRT